ncbi:hypothetical protein LTR37_002076 [Vermiconidia calcicola]|uniref:Uncharacterized protein n=1 Tax=Vermiconidia calcicola TaxID=1690605 RepID=A0ACC3NTW2_9PEZI|nr:hypothetical protein LTR37_002076 [Vermiconidia calcicola]
MFTALAILACEKYGSNRHTWDVELDKIENGVKIAWLSEISFLISTCSTKVSVLLFYRRLVQGTFSKKWRWATIAGMVFTMTYTVVLIIILLVNCSPTEAYWKAFSLTYNKDWYCHETKALNPVSGVLSMVTDLYSVVLPMAMLRHFEIDRRKKIALNAVFSLGLLVVAASAVRIYYLKKVGTATDLTWIGFDVFVWSQLELQLAMICASAPALRVLFRRYLRDNKPHTVHSNSWSHNGIRNDMCDSKQPDLATVDSLNTSDGFSEGSDRYMTKHNATPALEPVFEQDLECPRARTPVDLIKTPADFEAYALRNLESARHQTRATRPARPCQSPAEVLDDRTSPRSWLDDDNSS